MSTCHQWTQSTVNDSESYAAACHHCGSHVSPMLMRTSRRVCASCVCFSQNIVRSFSFSSSPTLWLSAALSFWPAAQLKGVHEGGGDGCSRARVHPVGRAARAGGGGWTGSVSGEEMRAGVRLVGGSGWVYTNASWQCRLFPSTTQAHTHTRINTGSFSLRDALAFRPRASTGKRLWVVR